MTVMQGSFVRRIFLPMLAGVVALFAIVGVSLWLTNRTTQDTDQVVRERHLHELSSTLLDHLQNMETGHRGYLLTRDLKFLEPYTAARPMVDEIVKRLKAAVAADPRASALIDQVSARVDDKLRAMIATLDLAGRYLRSGA